MLARNVPGLRGERDPRRPSARSRAGVSAAARVTARRSRASPSATPSKPNGSAIRTSPCRISKTPVPREIALAVTERAELFPGVRVDPESIRFYTDGTLYAPIIGYTGPITEQELAMLSGERLSRRRRSRTHRHRGRVRAISARDVRWREIERDAAQREIKTLALQRPTVGNTVALTIDDRLQKLLDAELRKGVDEDKFTQAVGVAMNPQNGEILAMVSIPGYDNNMFARGITTAEIAAAQRGRSPPAREQGHRRSSTPRVRPSRWSPASPH